MLKTTEKSEFVGQTYFKVITNLNLWYFHMSTPGVVTQVTRSLGQY